MRENVLRIEDEGSVRVLVLDRPAARNALSGELITALYQALADADADESVDALVLTGADPAFCAGVDLKQAAREGAAYFARFRTENCVARVAQVRKPVIGAVNGPAFTGGLELALGCDFLVASERASFADTHARVGVLPGGGLTARLPHLVGPGMARRMSMTGELVDARRAERIGLVTEVVPHGELRGRAIALAAAATEIPPSSLRALKALYVTGARPLVDPALAAEAEAGRTHAPDYTALERRRRKVTARNRAQLGGALPTPPSH
ncbi:enoyl-CoA hydratase [Streptomyces sp. NPDC001255]|uniref:enoyl-CoA hydratase n=1 Tax=Streptomyces sp. NPDC001255 TaxID=3364550 RepID=UPI0036C85897